MSEYDGDPATGFMFGIYRYVGKGGHITVCQPLYDEAHKVAYLHWDRDELKRLMNKLDMVDTLNDKNESMQSRLDSMQQRINDLGKRTQFLSILCTRAVVEGWTEKEVSEAITRGIIPDKTTDTREECAPPAQPEEPEDD